MTQLPDLSAPEPVGRLGDEPGLDETLAELSGLSPAERERLSTAVRRAQEAAERRVRESEERMRLVLEAGRMGTWEWEPDSGRHCWSPELERLVGLAPGEGPTTVEGFYRMVHPEDLPAIRAAAERAIAEGADHLDDEFRVLRPTGGFVWVASRSRLYRDQRGRLVRIVGVNVDVTARKQAEQAQRQSKESLDLALAAAEMGTWSRDIPTGRHSWDAAHYAIFGVSPESFAITDDAIWAVTHPDDRPRLMALARRALETGDSYRHEFRILRPDGTIRWCVGGASVTRDRHGRPVHMSGITYDITERKQIEEELRATNETLTAFLGACPLAVMVLDPDGTVRLWNEAAERMFGWSAAEVLGRFLPAITDDDHDQFLARLRAILDGQRVIGLEAIRMKKDGPFFAQIWTAALTVAYGRRQVVSLVADISERKRAEQAFQESQHFLQRLTETVPSVIYVYDLAANRNIYSNRQVWDALGYTPEEARTMGQAFLPAVIHPDDWATTPSHIAQLLALSDGEVIEREYRVRPRRGGWRWFFGREMIFARDPDGRPTQVLGSILDITERKEAEVALRESEARLAALALERQVLYEQEQAARAQAEEASRLKDEFLATVSHELRTPLTAFLGYAQLLQTRQRDEAYVARTVEKMVRSAQTQAQIIEDLLDVSRIVSGKLRIDPRPIALAPVLRAALDTVRPAVEAKGLNLRVDLGPGDTQIIGDAGRLQQVFWNLLSNATKFTPAGGAITVRLAQQGREMQLTVSDTGRGISADFLPFVFDRFRQADSSSQRVYGGLGLGLSIVRHLIELHGGDVRAASDGEGRGASFTVTLPLHTPVGEQ